MIGRVFDMDWWMRAIGGAELGTKHRLNRARIEFQEELEQAEERLRQREQIAQYAQRMAAARANAPPRPRPFYDMDAAIERILEPRRKRQEALKRMRAQREQLAREAEYRRQEPARRAAADRLVYLFRDAQPAPQRDEEPDSDTPEGDVIQSAVSRSDVSQEDGAHAHDPGVEEAVSIESRDADTRNGPASEENLDDQQDLPSGTGHSSSDNSPTVVISTCTTPPWSHNDATKAPTAQIAATIAPNASSLSAAPRPTTAPSQSPLSVEDQPRRGRFDSVISLVKEEGHTKTVVDACVSAEPASTGSHGERPLIIQSPRIQEERRVSFDANITVAACSASADRLIEAHRSQQPLDDEHDSTEWFQRQWALKLERRKRRAEAIKERKEKQLKEEQLKQQKLEVKELNAIVRSIPDGGEKGESTPEAQHCTIYRKATVEDEAVKNNEAQPTQVNPGDEAAPKASAAVQFRTPAPKVDNDRKDPDGRTTQLTLSLPNRLVVMNAKLRECPRSLCISVPPRVFATTRYHGRVVSISRNAKGWTATPDWMRARMEVAIERGDPFMEGEFMDRSYIPSEMTRPLEANRAHETSLADFLTTSDGETDITTIMYETIAERMERLYGKTRPSTHTTDDGVVVVKGFSEGQRTPCGTKANGKHPGVAPLVEQPPSLPIGWRSAMPRVGPLRTLAPKVEHRTYYGITPQRWLELHHQAGIF